MFHGEKEVKADREIFRIKITQEFGPLRASFSLKRYAAGNLVEPG